MGQLHAKPLSESELNPRDLVESCYQVETKKQTSVGPVNESVSLCTCIRIGWVEIAGVGFGLKVRSTKTCAFQISAAGSCATVPDLRATRLSPKPWRPRLSRSHDGHDGHRGTQDTPRDMACCHWQTHLALQSPVWTCWDMVGPCRGESEVPDLLFFFESSDSD